MVVDKNLILKLRNASHAGFSDCKKALEANNNDLEASIKWLRLKGIVKADNKHALKEAKEGGTWVKKNNEGVAIIELNSETDFTANNKNFCELAEEILSSILKNKVSNLDDTNNLIMSNGDTVINNCLHLSSITGEKIVLKRMNYFSISSSESVSCYRHNNGRMSTLLILDKSLPDEDIKGLSVHYAANNPKFISSDQVDPDWISSEKEVISALLKKENKPEQFHERIIEERIKKSISQNTLLEQPYMYDTSKSVKKILEELGNVKIKTAVYYGINS